MHVIEAHNQAEALGMHSYQLGMNHLGDMVSPAPGHRGDHDGRLLSSGIICPCVSTDTSTAHADVRGGAGEDDGPAGPHAGPAQQHHDARQQSPEASQESGLP